MKSVITTELQLFALAAATCLSQTIELLLNIASFVLQNAFFVDRRKKKKNVVRKECDLIRMYKLLMLDNPQFKSLIFNTA